MQDSGMLLKLDNTSWGKTLQIFHNFMQWHVVNTLFQEMKSRHNQKDPYWKLQPVPILEVATCCLHGKYGVEIRIMSLNSDNSHSWVRISHGSNMFVMNLNNNEQEIQKFSSKNMRQNWMRRILHADQRLKQNREEENLPALHKEQFLLRKEFGQMLNQGNICSPFFEISKKLILIFFVMHKVCIENMMERFNSGELIFFRNISCIALIGLIASGRKAWQEEEETRKDVRTVLILQKQLCFSELFKDIQEAILLILLYRTMWLFRATSSSTFFMSDVQSIYIPSSIRDWYLEVKIWTTDRQCSFSLWIPETRVIRVLIRSTWVSRVMHNVCTKHGNIGSTSILL